MNRRKNKVAVVIVTYNGAKWVTPCLTSVFASDYPVQVIVVDNDSTDSTTEIIRSQFPQTILIESEKNLGFGQANNLGIANALQQEADYIYLLNQDTTIDADCIGKLVNGFEQHPEFDLLSPAHYNGQGNKFDFGFLRYALADYSSSEINKWYSPKPGSCFQISFVNAAAWFIKSSVFEKIGGFSPLFFHYGEDREFVKRMHFHGLLLGLQPIAKIRHYRDDRNKDNTTWKFEKLAKYYLVGFLYRLSDVNHTLINRFFSGLYWLLKDSIALMFKGVWVAPVLFLHVLFNVFSSLNKVKLHRRHVINSASFLFLTQFMK